MYRKIVIGSKCCADLFSMFHGWAGEELGDLLRTQLFSFFCDKPSPTRCQQALVHIGKWCNCFFVQMFLCHYNR